MEKNSLPKYNLLKAKSGSLRMLPGRKMLYFWASLSLFMNVLLTIITGEMAQKTGLIYFNILNSLACTIVLGFTFKPSFRFPLGVYFMLLLFIWLFICTIVGLVKIAFSNPFSIFEFNIIRLVLGFFLGYFIVYGFPEQRDTFKKIVIPMYALSAIVGVLQFISFGPALAIANIYAPAEELDNWGGVNLGVRAIGLTSHPPHLTAECILAFALIFGAILVRKISFIEILASIFFLGTAIMAQSRILYLTIAGCIITMIVLSLRRDKKIGLITTSIWLILGALMFTVASKKLAYAIESGRNVGSLDYRVRAAWPQAFRIIEKTPWTGIGIYRALNYDFESGGNLSTKWRSEAALDSGYLLMVAYGGYPAGGIMALIIITGITGTILLFKNKSLTPSRRQMLFVFFIVFLMTLNNMMLNNVFITPKQFIMLFIILGLSMPSQKEREQEEYYNPFKKDYSALTERDNRFNKYRTTAKRV